MAGQGSADACRPCAAGSYAPTPMLGACLPCPAGTFMAQRGWGGLRCTECPANHYQPLEGQASASACVRCPAGSGSPPGTRAESGCVARPAVVCPAGQVASGNGTGCVAAACGAGQFYGNRSSSGAAVCGPCAAGTYGGGGNETSCVPCPAGAVEGCVCAGKWFVRTWFLFMLVVLLHCVYCIKLAF